MESKLLRLHRAPGHRSVDATVRLAEACFDINDVMIPGKTIRGILQGESIPKVFIPRLVELHAQGRFPFDKLVKFYDLKQINQAAEDSEKGGTIKPIIRLQ